MCHKLEYECEEASVKEILKNAEVNKIEKYSQEFKEKENIKIMCQ